MTRFSKFLIVWWGVVLVLAGCGTAKEVIVGETATSTSSVQAPTASSRQAVTPTVETIPPTNTPTNTPTDSPQPIRANYPNLGSAPELENEVWLNTEQPVTLASQRGKVVLVEFWTYG